MARWAVVWEAAWALEAWEAAWASEAWEAVWEAVWGSEANSLPGNKAAWEAAWEEAWASVVCRHLVAAQCEVEWVVKWAAKDASVDQWAVWVAQ